MQEVNPIYNFTVNQEGEYTKIFYTQKLVSNSILIPIALYTAVPAIFVASSIFGHSASMGSVFITWLTLMAIIPCGIVYFINRSRKTGEIKISKSQLIADGKSYQLDHISAFLIQTRKGREVSERTYTSTGYYTPNLAGTAHALSNGIRSASMILGNSLKEKLNAAGFMIAIRYATKEVVIANYLGEFEAESLLDKLTQIAGYTKPA